MKKLFFRIYLFAAAAMLASCSTRNTNNPVTHAATDTDALRDSISAIISDVTGEIGVAAIIDSKDLVHMAHMDIHYGFSVNGVAYLHTEIHNNRD